MTLGAPGEGHRATTLSKSKHSNGRGPSHIGLKENITGQPLIAHRTGLSKTRVALNLDPQPIASDKSIKYDYDIVYVRAPRTVKDKDGKDRLAMVWPDASQPFNMRASTDLMLLHPDGSTEELVAGAPGAIADPYVSFDAQWVYYTHFHDVAERGGADVYKVNVKSRRSV